MTAPTIKIIPESFNNFIYLKYLDDKKPEDYIDSINAFLNTYNPSSHVENARYCDFNNPRPENSFCVFERRSLGRCSELKDFGYTRGSPCFFFTLSQASCVTLEWFKSSSFFIWQVLNWIPIVLNGSDIQQHSDPFFNIPEHLNSTLITAESEQSNEVGEFVKSISHMQWIFELFSEICLDNLWWWHCSR